jgi:hypothetical protein
MTMKEISSRSRKRRLDKTGTLKIYIAGPYTPLGVNSHDAPRIAHRNVSNAIRAGIAVIEKGHIPFIPHLTHFIHVETERPLPASYFYEYDMTWLQYCDAVLYLGNSKGADRELNWAKKRGLRIFYSVGQIPSATKEGKFKVWTVGKHGKTN